jgi:hypothetical protein
MSKNINPEVLGGLDWERQFAQTHSFGGQKRRVQLDRGESWLIRFLPIELGGSKRFYARISRHWQDKRQIICPRLTEPAFGGNVEAYCPVCSVAEEINADKNEEISKAGYKLSAQMQWFTYCAVFEKTAKNGEPRQEPMNEVLLPYEFNHYKGTWDELCVFIQQNKRRTPLSVLDYQLGNDFFVTRGGKGIRLDKQESAPIFEPTDPKFDEWIAKLEANCKDPVVKVPTDKQLEDFAAKAEEAILSTGQRSGRPTRYNPDDEREPDADAEGPGGTHDAPPRGHAPARPAAAATAAPTRRAAAPARPAAAPARAAAPAAAPTRRAAAPAPADPEPEQQPESDLPPEGEGDLPPEGELLPEGAEGDLPPEGEGDLPPEEQQPEPEVEPAPATPARRPAAVAQAPARPAATAAARPVATATARPQAATPATAVRRTAPVATATARPQAATAAPVRGAASAAAPRRTNGAPLAQENLDPEENIPEESTDQAPPEPMEGEEQQAPPPVQQRGTAALGDRVRNRVAAITASKK